MNDRGLKECVVALQIRGTTQVGLTWAGNSELLVSYPNGASVKQLGSYDGWPRITLRKTEHQ
jgi:hypothetical protein